ncbi:type II toxin-antitoxin system RelE/ParE family toxin [Kribbella sp. NPDC051587]|uniref:type II toxin-antitoxin system RelE/ParE family toxin n=1 Tax=Kribbella sp. NPDC051587 TaxID=3364119 RepID=UPI00379729FF
MNYRVEFHAAALAQLQGIPPAVFDVLVEHVAELVRAPWDAQMPDQTEPSFRQSVFGSVGLLSFYVDDDRELIRIFDVTWAG